MRVEGVLIALLEKEDLADGRIVLEIKRVLGITETPNHLVLFDTAI